MMWVWLTAVAAVLLNSDGLDRRPPPRLLPFDPLPWSGRFTRPDMQYRAMPYVADPSKSFSRVASCCGTGGAAFSEPNVVAASRKHGLFSPGDECYGDHAGRTHVVAEWGYEFQVFAPDKFPSSPCVSLTMPTYAAPPASRTEALARMERYYQCRIAAVDRANGGAATDVIELTCHYYYTAFGAALGRTSAVAVEVGENGNSINAHFAFARGTARQFQLPWMVDFSAWMAGFITDYSTVRPWGPASAAGGDGGHSVSLFKRTYFTTYLQGASQLTAEAGAYGGLDAKWIVCLRFTPPRTRRAIYCALPWCRCLSDADIQ